MNLTNTSVDKFKKVMGSYPTGIAVITTFDEDGAPYGLTVNSISSISLDPLLVLWSLDNKSNKLEAFKKAKKFTMHILADDQADICWRFAGKTPAEERFIATDWETSEFGLPIIKNALGVFECKTFQEILLGDHTVFVGEVENVIMDENKNPLLYYKRHVDKIPQGWLPQ